MLLLELIVHHSFHQARFAYTCIADDNQFEKVILGGQRFVCQHLERDLFDLLNLALFHLMFLLYLRFMSLSVCVCLSRSVCESIKTFLLYSSADYSKI